ncbi:MAG: hypothetical protein CMI12_08165 [Oceanospirillum sp.]|nr:hypothetical protein [Oceanospirillum sp.]
MLSEKAEKIAAFIGKRLEDNLAAFKAHLPDVYSMFSSYQEERYFLIYGNDGEVNLVDRESEKLLYGDNPVQELYDVLSNYENSPLYRPYLMGVKTDEDFEKIIPVHHSCTTAIGKIQLDLIYEQMRENKIATLQGGGVEDFQRLPDFVNSMFVFSTGLGFDIEKLYMDRDIKYLYIVENCFDVFYASLQLIDWKVILEKSIAKGHKIAFFFSDDIEELVSDVSAYIPSVGRHNAAGCYVYSSFYRPENDELYQGFKDVLDLSIFAGFGFYDDSRMSVAHTVNNIKSGVRCIKSDKTINKLFGQEQYPAFIIGSGPSLDSDIAFLKENQPRAVIISCCSAWNALYANDIVPDFHIELERTAHVLHWIESSSRDSAFSEYLNQIHFIGASQVHPGVFKLFKSCGQIPKDSETGSLMLYSVLGDKGVRMISRVSPTCVHTGLTVALVLGFYNIYFFGVDMGYQSYDSHHSKYSLYDELSSDMEEKLVPANHFEVEVEPNFEGEKILASGFFPMFKRFLDMNIEAWNESFSGRINIFNCSNGAKLKGATPTHADDIDWGEYQGKADNKKEVCKNIMDAYFAYTASGDDVAELEYALTSSFEKVSKMCDWLSSKLVPVDCIADAHDLLDELAFKFHSEIHEMGLEEEDSWLFSIFDGSLLYALSGIQSLLSFPLSEQRRIDSFNESLKILDKFFTELSADYQANALINDKKEFYNFF